MTTTPTKTTYASSAPHSAPYIVYINGIEVPAKSVSLRYGVWQMPEMQIEMVADPVLVRLGSEDRIQVQVFYYDDCDVDPSVSPAFRLFGEGEITGWGYRNTPGSRSIIFTVINQIAIFTQLFVQFMTTLDDMIGHATGPADATGFATPSSQLIYPYALFNQGLIPTGTGNAVTNRITKPFDFVYNAVRGMMASVVPDASRTIPAANFFTRWARLSNFHNRFAASPFFDETDGTNIFPVLSALQSVSAVDVIIKDLIPNIQNAGSIWDMIQVVYQTMLMEVSMIPSMPLVTVDLTSSLVLTTNFAADGLLKAAAGGSWTPVLSDASRKLTPKRLQNYFPKPQMLFSIPPSCNVIFPSQLKNIAYEENYATQPTRLYFNDETLTTITKMPVGGVQQTVMNALSIAYPPSADLYAQARDTKHPKFNSKNFLIYPEEFFKGPVMDRRDVPKWLFFLKQSDLRAGGGASSTAAGTVTPSDNAAASSIPPPAQTGATPAPRPASAFNPQLMVTQSENGKIGVDGRRTYLPKTELLRSAVEKATQGSSVPSEFALVWINIESGGDYRASDSDHATGIFQLLPEECAKLRSKNFPNGVSPSSLINDPNNTVAILAGIDYIVAGRKLADQLATAHGITGWPEGDKWRLVKFAKHDLPAYAPMALTQSAHVLGRPPVDWSEFYNSIINAANGLQAKALNNATATGVLPGATGTMISDSDKTPFTAGAARPAPSTPSDASSSIPVQPTAPPEPVVTPTAATTAASVNEDVYHLYAKFEFFRERYAKRSGSATVAWNPYVVPGFPGVIFDQRATRVDLMVYFTTVQQYMDHNGQRQTSLSYMYGRQFQELFDLMANEFSQNDATARGSAPQEPIRDISKVTQSFVQAETYYQRLFYGAQALFGKDASFDFRKIVGYAPVVAGGSPTPIFVDGPDVVSQDATVAASQLLTTLLATRDRVTATLLSVGQQIVEANAEIAATAAPTNAPGFGDVSSAVNQAQNQGAQADLAIATTQQAALQASLIALNARITAAQATIASSTNAAGSTRVEHNLDSSQQLVPLPASQALFESYDAAMRYNWRPICTLDEYIVFLDTAGQGPIPAVGHPRSVGARFFDRINTFIGAPDGFSPPPDVDGITGSTVSGISPASFPQTRAIWDAALLAYKNNVLNVKAPRT